MAICTLHKKQNNSQNIDLRCFYFSIWKV